MDKIGKIGFLGGGKIAQAMAKGFISAGLVKPADFIASVHPSDKVSFEAFKNVGVDVVVDNNTVVKESDVVFISVKPQVVPTVLAEVKSQSDGRLFVSVAMGVTLDTLEHSLSQRARVIRAMPNTPALVQSACSVYARGRNASSDDAHIAQSLLQAIGTCEEVDEHMLDPITALSGSGPAYVFVLIEALADGAVRMGLPRDMALRLASQTVMGSGLLARDSREHPAQLRDNVTSPSGSTAAGLKHLEGAGILAQISSNRLPAHH